MRVLATAAPVCPLPPLCHASSNHTSNKARKGMWYVGNVVRGECGTWAGINGKMPETTTAHLPGDEHGDDEADRGMLPMRSFAARRGRLCGSGEVGEEDMACASSYASLYRSGCLTCRRGRGPWPNNADAPVGEACRVGDVALWVQQEQAGAGTAAKDNRTGKRNGKGKGKGGGEGGGGER